MLDLIDIWQVSYRSNQILPNSTKSWLDLASFGQPNFDRGLTATRWGPTHPNRLLLLVSGESRYWGLEVNESVSGWAKTRLVDRPTTNFHFFFLFIFFFLSTKANIYIHFLSFHFSTSSTKHTQRKTLIFSFLFFYSSYIFYHLSFLSFLSNRAWVSGFRR